MENFTIKADLSTQDYTKILLTRLFKKPTFIVAVFLGLCLEVILVSDCLNVANWSTDTPTFEIFCGVSLLVIPTLIMIIQVRQFKSRQGFIKDITYTFGDKGVTIQSLTFKTEILWTHFLKKKENSKFLILYHNKKYGYFIDKTKLTTDQLDFIKSKVRCE